MPPGVDRLTGWREALTEAGIEPGPVEYGDFTADSGAAAMAILLRREAEIDGVFAANDQMAVGAYQALAAAGKNVPADIAVVGFDDSYFSVSTDPALATSREPRVEMGAEMGRVLARLIEGAPAAQVTMLETELIVRAST